MGSTSSENGGLEHLGRQPYCYLTTVGRRSGDPHTIEIWFASDGSSLHLISGGGNRSDWVRNLIALPDAEVRVGDWESHVRARLPLPDSPERDEAIERLHQKYHRQVSGTLAGWRRDAFIVALDTVEAP